MEYAIVLHRSAAWPAACPTVILSLSKPSMRTNAQMRACFLRPSGALVECRVVLIKLAAGTKEALLANRQLRSASQERSSGCQAPQLARVQLVLHAASRQSTVFELAWQMQSSR